MNPINNFLDKSLDKFTTDLTALFGKSLIFTIHITRKTVLATVGLHEALAESEWLFP